MGKSRRRPPKRKGVKQRWGFQMINTGSSPNREILAGYVNRAGFVPSAMAFDDKSAPPNEPRIKALALAKLKKQFDDMDIDPRINHLIAKTGRFTLWLFHNSQMSRFMFVKQIHDTREVLRSPTYLSRGVADMKLSSSRVTWIAVI